MRSFKINNIPTLAYHTKYITPTYTDLYITLVDHTEPCSAPDIRQHRTAEKET